jgi:WD40 repeat protein
LWRDPELQLALNWRDKHQPNETWASRYHPGFAAAVQFLTESSQAREAERAERQLQRQRELDAEHDKAESQAKNARRMLWAAVICGSLALAAGVFGWKAHQASVVAEASRAEAQITQSRSLVKTADTDPSDQSSKRDASLKILLALEALPDEKERIERPVVFDAQNLLSRGIDGLRESAVLDHPDPVLAVAVTPDGGRMVTGSADTARVWDTGTKAQLFRLGHAGAVVAVAVTPDGARIVTGSDDQSARVWDASTRAELFRLEGQDGPVIAVAITPDGSRIVTGAGNVARVWDASTRAELFRLEGHERPVLAVAVTPDGSRIVTGSEDKTARVWDARTGAELLRLEGHNGAVLAVAITPDGARIVTGSADKSARVWNGGALARSYPIDGHGGRVSAVAITPDGARIVTGSDDTTARVWDARGRQLRLEGHDGSVLAVAITPDGARTVTGSEDKTARVWASGPLARQEHQFDTAQNRQAVIDRAKAVVPRCLTIAQRRLFVLDPRPPGWCIEMRKYPYDAQLWKDWKAGKKLAAADSKIADIYGDFANDAIEAADFRTALIAADLGITFDPEKIWITINQAHAHMFLGRTDEARQEYLAHPRATLEQGQWEKVIVDDFEKLRRQGRTHSLMDDIEREFKPALTVEAGK